MLVFWTTLIILIAVVVVDGQLIPCYCDDFSPDGTPSVCSKDEYQLPSSIGFDAPWEPQGLATGSNNTEYRAVFDGGLVSQEWTACYHRRVLFFDSANVTVKIRFMIEVVGTLNGTKLGVSVRKAGISNEHEFQRIGEVSVVSAGNEMAGVDLPTPNNPYVGPVDVQFCIFPADVNTYVLLDKLTISFDVSPLMMQDPAKCPQRPSPSPMPVMTTSTPTAASDVSVSGNFTAASAEPPTPVRKKLEFPLIPVVGGAAGVFLLLICAAIMCSPKKKKKGRHPSGLTPSVPTSPQHSTTTSGPSRNRSRAGSVGSRPRSQSGSGGGGRSKSGGKRTSRKLSRKASKVSMAISSQGTGDSDGGGTGLMSISETLQLGGQIEFGARAGSSGGMLPSGPYGKAPAGAFNQYESIPEYDSLPEPLNSYEQLPLKRDAASAYEQISEPLDGSSPYGLAPSISTSDAYGRPPGGKIGVYNSSNNSNPYCSSPGGVGVYKSVS